MHWRWHGSCEHLGDMQVKPDKVLLLSDISAGIRGKALLLLIILSFSVIVGCEYGAADELFILPRRSDNITALDELISKEYDEGCEPLSPVKGIFRRPVIMFDINGDGADEAFAFFRVMNGGLRICSYRFDQTGCFPVGFITREGNYFYKAEFADINGDGVTESVISRHIGSDVTEFDVYSVDQSEFSLLFSGRCTDFHIIDGLTSNGSKDLVTLHKGTGENGYLTLYRFFENNEIEMIEAALSSGIMSIERIVTSLLSDSVTGIFVESSSESGETVTDIFVFYAGKFMNIAADDSGVSIARRAYPVYCFDIDSDNRLEVPSVRLLPAGSGSDEAYRIFDWFAFDSSGKRTLKFSTYHDFIGGWYFIIPQNLSEGFTVREENADTNCREVIFSAQDISDGSRIDFLSVRNFSGETVSEPAQSNSFFVLFEQEDVTTAAEIKTALISQAMAARSFFLIDTNRLPVKNQHVDCGNGAG